MTWSIVSSNYAGEDEGRRQACVEQFKKRLKVNAMG